MKQIKLFKPTELAFGGELLKSRKGRSLPRPLAVRHSMHLVMRSSLAKGDWSFRKKKHERAIELIVAKFSNKYGVRVLSMANVGNHLHLHLRLGRRASYRPFIRAVSAAIAMAVTGASRWCSLKKLGVKRFWDRRPFSRVVMGFRAALRVEDYIRVNHIEGFGFSRGVAKIMAEADFFLSG